MASIAVPANFIVANASDWMRETPGRSQQPAINLPPSVVFFDGRLVRSLTRAVAQLHRTISLPNRFASRTMQCEALPSSSKNALLHARISLVMCTCND
jgi:hypothetical protein